MWDDDDQVLKTVESDDGDTIEVWVDYSVAPAVGGLRDGETIEERNARVLAVNEAERRAARPGDVMPTVDGKPLRRAAKVARPPRALDATDEAATRLFFRRGAEAAGLTFTELVRKRSPGRTAEAEAEAEKARRDVLARLVLQARDERQTRVETIAVVIRRPIVTVHQLAADGRKLTAAG